MPTQNTYGLPLSNPALFPTSTTISSQAMTASDNAVASFFQFEGGHGNLVGAIVGVLAIASPPVLRLSLQGIASRGTPDGTIKGSGTVKSDFTPSIATGLLTFDSPYTGSTGELLSLVVAYLSGTIDATHRATIAHRITTGYTLIHAPSSALQTAGTWTTSATPPHLAPVYADGYVGNGFAPVTALTNVLPTSASTNPKYYGTLFRPDVTMVSSCVYVVLRPQATNSFTISLFEGTNTTPVATSGVVNCDLLTSTVNNSGPLVIPMPSYTLTAGTDYRWVLSMNSAAPFTTWVSATFGSQAALQAFRGLTFGTTGDSTPTWTDFNSGTDWRAFPIVPGIDSIISAAGGGLLVRQGMDGGFDQ